MTITLKAPRLPAWRPRLPRVTRAAGHNAAQSVGALAVLVGISVYSVPAAFIVGGLTLIAAIERQPA